MKLTWNRIKGLKCTGDDGRYYYFSGGSLSDRFLDVASFLDGDARMLRRWVEHQQEPRHAPYNPDRAGHVEDRLPAERGDQESAYRHGYPGTERRGCKQRCNL